MQLCKEICFDYKFQARVLSFGSIHHYLNEFPEVATITWQRNVHKRLKPHGHRSKCRAHFFLSAISAYIRLNEKLISERSSCSEFDLVCVRFACFVHTALECESFRLRMIATVLYSLAISIDMYIYLFSCSFVRCTAH